MPTITVSPHARSVSLSLCPPAFLFHHATLAVGSSAFSLMAALHALFSPLFTLSFCPRLTCTQDVELKKAQQTEKLNQIKAKAARYTELQGQLNA